MRRRALFLLGGLLIGLAAVCMALLADNAQAMFAMMREHYPYLPVVLTPIGFGLSAWLANRFFDGSQGSGIPQVMAARRLADQEERSRLVSLRMAIGKILLLGLGLGVGASAGREGPTVQVGAAIMFALDLRRTGSRACCWPAPRRASQQRSMRRWPASCSALRK